MPFPRFVWTVAAVAGCAFLVYGALYRGAGAWALAGTGLLAVAWRTRDWRPRIRPADLALTAGSAVFATCLAFGAAETAVRMFVHPAAWQGDGLVAPHPDRIWTPAPGRSGTGYVANEADTFAAFDFSIAAYGLRGPEPRPKAPEEFRLLLLGDSFTFGRGVSDEDTIPVQLERLLRERFPERPITVINGGCGGYAPWQAGNLLDELGWPLEPDAVVLQALLDNDLADTLARTGRVADAYEPGNAFFKSVYGSYHRDIRARIEDWVYQRSRVYKLLVQRTVGAWRLTLLLDHLRGFDGPLTPALPPSVARPPYLEAARTAWDPALEEAWITMQADVTAIRDACKQRGLPFALWAVPSAAYVIDADWPFAGDPAYDRGKPEALLRAFAEAAGIPYHDAYSRFRSLPESRGMYYPADGHFTPAGAAAAAAFLAEALAPLVPSES